MLKLTLPLAALFLLPVTAARPDPAGNPRPHRSPVDLLLAGGERWLFTANQHADTVSAVEVATGKVVCEVPCGERPSNLAMTPDGRRLLATATLSGELIVYSWDAPKLRNVGRVRLRGEPRGVAVSPDGRTAYVALTTLDAVAVIDLRRLEVAKRIPTARWPRHLVLSPDGGRLAVGVNGSGGVAVIDTAEREQMFVDDFLGLNMGQMDVSPDGKYAYFPWMVYRQNPITPGNIRLGWVLASRIARVRLDKKARREAIALDPRGEAVADPHGLALSPDGQRVVCAASGTQELLVYRLPGLPLQDYGGPGDHIDEKLLKDKSRFYRVPLGGRPMFVRFSQNSDTVYVANYLKDAVQVVSLKSRKVTREIALGSPETVSLAREGEAIFYDGKRSLDQWYSCHSCHYEGHINAVSMDTRNDGRFGNFKTVLSLRGVTETGPWTWHGWQTDLTAAMKKSLRETMLSRRDATDRDAAALIAFLKTLPRPANPHLTEGGKLTPAAERGRAVFYGSKAQCQSCHKPPLYTRGRTMDVGTGKPTDRYGEFNPPPLAGVHEKVKLLHDGRAGTLREALTGDHAPHKLNGNGRLTDAELDDLIAYLKSL